MINYASLANGLEDDEFMHVPAGHYRELLQAKADALAEVERLNLLLIRKNEALAALQAEQNPSLAPYDADDYE